jgi:Protein of unknown function (DUF3397)
MTDLLKWLLSFAFTLPLISLIILLVILRITVKNKKKSILLAVDLSTIFFIISVHFLLITIFEQSFLLYIIFGLITLLMIVYFGNSRKSKISSLKIASKKVWRLSFLFFLLSYIFLTFYGIIIGMISYAFVTP